MGMLERNQLKLQGENPGRKGQLAIATEVLHDRLCLALCAVPLLLACSLD
jgi:hypothetical protein